MIFYFFAFGVEVKWYEWVVLVGFVLASTAAAVALSMLIIRQKKDDKAINHKIALPAALMLLLAVILVFRTV